MLGTTGATVGDLDDRLGDFDASSFCSVRSFLLVGSVSLTSDGVGDRDRLREDCGLNNSFESVLLFFCDVNTFLISAGGLAGFLSSSHF